MKQLRIGWVALFWRFLCLMAGVLECFGAGSVVEDWQSRYAPFSPRVDEIELRVDQSSWDDVWWESPSRIREGRNSGELPLSGLHLALDPGHIGGDFARAEGRSFRIGDSDFDVREGDLVLEVANLISRELGLLGAEVTLLRDSGHPVNQVDFIDAVDDLIDRQAMPDLFSPRAWSQYIHQFQRLFFREVYVLGELGARARLVNEVIQPDLLLSLHINAAPWPKGGPSGELLELVKRDHSHVLIFGGVMASELDRPHHRGRMIEKMSNRSGPIEVEIGAALGLSFGRMWDLPHSQYEGRNAVVLDAGGGYLWARNLFILREVDCPVVLLEPFLANSHGAYERVQRAIGRRVAGELVGDDDILVEYANAVMRAVVEVYGSRSDFVSDL